jgi:hypothetical protein
MTLPAGQQNDSAPWSSSDLRVNALSSNSSVALDKSSNARMNADRLLRNSAHPSNEQRSNVLQASVARRSNSVKMRKRNKPTEREHWSSKRPSGDSARRSENRRRQLPEPISR